MALIFDHFETIEGAGGFVAAVKEKGREATLYTNANEAAEVGFFPFQLGGAAVVLVDREEDYSWEQEIIEMVMTHGGRFAGT